MDRFNTGVALRSIQILRDDNGLVNVAHVAPCFKSGGRGTQNRKAEKAPGIEQRISSYHGDDKYPIIPQEGCTFILVKENLVTKQTENQM